MKLSIVPSVRTDGNYAIIEYILVTALDMHLFEDIMFEHSEYDTEWQTFIYTLRDRRGIVLPMRTRILFGDGNNMLGQVIANVEVVDKVKEYIAAQDYSLSSDNRLVLVSQQSYL